MPPFLLAEPRPVLRYIHGGNCLMNRSINIRAAGLVVSNGLVLLQKNVADEFWAVPGGKVESGESSEQALLREVD